MAELTPNLGLAKPTINGEETENTWGYDLNNNFDLLDEAVVQSRVSDGDKGDIVVSGQGEFWAFDPTVVTSAGRGVIAVDAQAGLLEQNGATAFRKRGITVHNQPPVGGVDGDLWLQYNLALPPEVNWELSSAYFNTRAEAAASDIPGPVKVLQTGGYSVAGDCGHGTHRRVDALPTHKGWFRSVDRYKADGGIDAMNGGYWEIVPDSGEIRIEQFGGKADWNGTTGTDNVQPLYDAMTMDGRPKDSVWEYTNIIRFRGGRYFFSKAVYFYKVTAIKGAHSTFVSNAARTMFHFPNNVSGFVFHSINTGAVGPLPGGGSETESGVAAVAHSGAGGSSIHDIGMAFGDGVTWPTDLTRSAILARTNVDLQNVYIQRAPGRGVYIRAYAGYGGDQEGNANNWSMRNVYVHSCRSDAFYIEGADANGGYAIGLTTHTEVGGCGIRNHTSYSNWYGGLQITGYGNGGVHYAGNLYILLDPANSTTTPGTNNHIWYLRGPGGPDAQFPTWVSGTTYQLKLPIWDTGGGSFYYTPYVEATAHGSALLHIGVGSMSFGGTCPSTIYSNAMTGGGDTVQGVGARVQFDPGQLGYVESGGLTYVRMGGSREGVGYGPGGGINFIDHRRLSDGDASAQWGYTGGDITYAYLNQTPYWQQTTATSTKTFGRGTPQSLKLMLFDPVLVDPTDGSNNRIIGYRGAVPTQIGEYALGERYFNVNSFTGVGAWVCTQAGVNHEFIWASGATYGFDVYVKAAANRVYKSKSYGVSTTEPTHTSGTVTTADGHVWTYAGNTVPIFKTVIDVAQQPAYTLAALSTSDRALSGSNTLSEVIDVLGTLISDLQAARILAP